MAIQITESVLWARIFNNALKNEQNLDVGEEQGHRVDGRNAGI